MIKKTIILILAITCKSIFIAQISAQNLPNIVMYLADDQTQADGSVYGAKVLKTPTAEKLAAAGMTFDNAFVASPSCAPSRGAMLTGLMPARNGAECNHTYPSPNKLILTENLQKAGYKVFGFGKVAHGAMNKQMGDDGRFDFQSNPTIDLFQNVSEYFNANNTTGSINLVGDANYAEIQKKLDSQLMDELARIGITEVKPSEYYLEKFGFEGKKEFRGDYAINNYNKVEVVVSPVVINKESDPKSKK